LFKKNRNYFELEYKEISIIIDHYDDSQDVKKSQKC